MEKNLPKLTQKALKSNGNLGGRIQLIQAVPAPSSVAAPTNGSTTMVTSTPVKQLQQQPVANTPTTMMQVVNTPGKILNMVLEI